MTFMMVRDEFCGDNGQDGRGKVSKKISFSFRCNFSAVCNCDGMQTYTVIKHRKDKNSLVLFDLLGLYKMRYHSYVTPGLLMPIDD